MKLISLIYCTILFIIFTFSIVHGENFIVFIPEFKINEIIIEKQSSKIVLIDVCHWKVEDDIFDDYGTLFNFPKDYWSKEQGWNYDFLNDYMRNLSWIKENSIVIFLKNLSKFIKCGDITKKNIMDSYNKIILPYWENTKYDKRWRNSGEIPKTIRVYAT